MTGKVPHMGSETTSNRVAKNLADVYPEVSAGGFSRANGTVEFYSRIRALCAPEMKVLDLGAGRGQQIISAKSDFIRDLVTLKGKVKRLVGADVDPIVRENPYLDSAEVIVPGETMPFAANEFDLIFADWVLEHVVTPTQFAQDVARILKPGGWFCARTPNRWGMTGLATNLIPSKYHAGIVTKLQPGDRQDIDAFPTAYELNTRSRLRKHSKPDLWEDFS